MSRVLVTGATGSLGSALTRRLVADGIDEVAVLVLPGSPRGGLAPCWDRVRVLTGDLRDPQSLRAALHGIEQVYHVAGEPTLLNRLRPRMQELNHTAAVAVAQAAAAAGARRMVHTSSISAIGYPPDGEIADESFDLARSVTRNAYLDTKRAGEEGVLRVGARCDLDVVVVNPAGVIAPYSHPRFGWAALVEQGRRGRLVAYPPGGVAVCAADDFVTGALAAMRVGRPGQRYILATANLTYRELFGLVNQTLSRPAPRWPVPGGLVRAASVAAALRGRTVRDPMRSPLLVPENARLANRRIYYSPAKARRELGLGSGDLRQSVLAVHHWLSGQADRVPA